MPHAHYPHVVCAISGKSVPASEAMPGELVRPGVAALIHEEHPDWDGAGFVSLSELNRYRGRYVERALAEEKGELSALEEDVLKSMREHEIMSEDVNEIFDERLTIGQRAADAMADFGGSWGFILVFAMLMGGWIALNTSALFSEHFDPFPYILLNLILSCLAAIQAPVIMMSQNRQEAKDRLRAEHDYRVNLKAELEIRHLHEKIDHLVRNQWQRLLEIQQIQLQLMEEISEQRKQRS